MAAGMAFRLIGREALSRDLARGRRRAEDLRPAWPVIDAHITRREEEQWRTEGALTGGWPPLNPRYAARKRRTPGVREGLMERSGRLLEAMVNPFAPGGVHRAERDRYERGTSLPYAAVHQQPKPSNPLPKREVLVFTEADERFALETMDRAAFGWI